MTAQSDAERVLLTLVGLADADGRLTLAKTEALDYARVPAPVFERTLVQLVDEGLIEQSGRVDRAARRFIIKARDRRAEGLAYITRNRDAVDRIVAARAQLDRWSRWHRRSAAAHRARRAARTGQERPAAV